VPPPVGDGRWPGVLLDVARRPSGCVRDHGAGRRRGRRPLSLALLHLGEASVEQKRDGEYQDHGHESEGDEGPIPIWDVIHTPESHAANVLAAYEEL